MAISKAQQKAVNKYIKTHYDKYQFTMPKGKKEIINQYAQKRGLSINQYVNFAIDNQLKIDGYSPDNTPDGGD